MKQDSMTKVLRDHKRAARQHGALIALHRLSQWLSYQEDVVTKEDLLLYVQRESEAVEKEGYISE